MFRRSHLVLALCAAFATACGSDAGVAPEHQPPSPLLARVTVTPDGTLLTPGGTAQLVVEAWDGNDLRIVDSGDWSERATYVSSDPGIAEVSISGRVTAITPGIAKITASLTIGDRTRSNTATVKVDSGSVGDVLLTMDRMGGWSPTRVSVKAGSTVTWVIPDDVQNALIFLDVWNADAEKLEFLDGVATRTFSTPGDYYYGSGGGLFWYEEGGLITVY
jgi:plastocyanin